MKKPDNFLYNFYREKREKKNERRKDTWKPYLSDSIVAKKEDKFKFAHDKRVMEHIYFDLDNYLLNKEFYQPSTKQAKISFPEIFSLQLNYEESLKSIQTTISNLMRHIGKKIELDFSKCKTADFDALFLLGVLIREYNDFLKRLEDRLLITKTTLDLKITHSRKKNVNIFLLITQFVPQAFSDQSSDANEKIDLMPVFSMGFVKGTKIETHYLKNKKGPAATAALSFVNKCLLTHDYALNSKGANNLGGIISEVLNNAEDHGWSGEWYISAVFLKSQDKDEKEVVGELNIAIANFGDSFFEGFEKTRNENSEVYDKMNELYEIVSKKCPVDTFSKENFFTLYALQDGFSRLKYESESRGTGTMKFINSFLELGDYEDIKREVNPYLMIISGQTKIISTPVFKPFMESNNYYMSLNPEKDLTKAPSVDNLKKLNLHFPGTLLSAKIYLNTTHLQSKTGNGS